MVGWVDTLLGLWLVTGVWLVAREYSNRTRARCVGRVTTQLPTQRLLEKVSYVPPKKKGVLEQICALPTHADISIFFYVSVSQR